MVIVYDLLLHSPLLASLLISIGGNSLYYQVRYNEDCYNEDPSECCFLRVLFLYFRFIFFLSRIPYPGFLQQFPIDL
jgi:hypothetical protein